MSWLVLETEWRIALKRRRLFALNVGVPLALVIPIAVADAPRPHAAAVYCVLFVIHATFGSAIPLVRDAEAGILRRVLWAGVSPASYFLQRAVAAASLDWIQLLPSMLVAAWSLGATADALVVLSGGLALALWTANALGTFVAVAARSLAEAALFSAITALVLLHVSGVFRPAAPGSLAGALELVAPFRALHEGMLTGPFEVGAGGVWSSLGWALGLAAALWLLARQLGSRLSGTALEW